MRGLVFAATVMATFWAERAEAQTPDVDPAFIAWRDDFIERAIAQGRAPTALTALFDGVTPDPNVLVFDRRAGDGYTSAIWDYLDAQVSDTRVATGRALRVESATLLEAIEAAYGVDPATILAIWGMETRYGAVSLDYDARRSIATLAYAGRRKLYFETQLSALAQMIERGQAPAGFASSWDGGLGQAQFMPESFLSDAVDWDHDGAADLWGSRGDVFASIAHYLQARGWRTGEPVLSEVRLVHGVPEGAARRVRTIAEWASLGVMAHEPLLSANTQAQLLLPAGSRGPAFFVFSNFDVLKSYNGGTRYALAAALLARAIDGAPPFVAAWPRPADGLLRQEVSELQTLLAASGYDVGAADGVIGERTWRATRAFAADAGLQAPGYPNRTVLEALRRRAADLAQPIE